MSLPRTTLIHKLSSCIPIRLIVGGFFLLAFLCLTAPLSGQGQTETIVQTGDAAGTNGIHFFFLNLRMNNQGQIAYASNNISGTSGGNTDNAGVYLVDGVTHREIARRGQATSDGLYGTFNYQDMDLNDSGHVIFHSNFMTGHSQGGNEGIFLFDGTNVRDVARDKELTGNGQLNSLDANFRLDNQGRAAFVSRFMENTAGGTADDLALFFNDGNTTVEIARKGDATANGDFASFAQLDSRQHGVTFASSLTGTSGGTADNSALFHFDGSNTNELFRKGHATANGTLGNFASVAANEAGQIVFQSTSMAGTTNGNQDHFASFMTDAAGSHLTELIRSGDALGSGGFVSSFSTRSDFSEAGLAVLTNISDTFGGSATSQGIQFYDGNQWSEFARQGDATANGDLGVLFGPDVNNFGQIAYLSAQMTGTSGGSTDNSGLFISDGIETLEVQRTGDLVDGHTITSFRDYQFNDYGQVAIHMNTDQGELITRFTPDLYWRANTSGDWSDRQNWTLSIDPNSPHDVFIDNAVSLTVNGPSAVANVNRLEIGGGNGLITFDLQPGTTLNALNGVTVKSNGTLTGEGTISGNVLNQGRVSASNLTVAGTLTNESWIEGGGSIHADVINASGGEVRVAAGEHMMFGGPGFVNAGRVENIVGEVEFNGLVQNSAGGLITGHDATYRFNGGLNNEGSVELTSGINNIFGDINNLSGGDISVGGGTQITFHDDLIQNGTLKLSAFGSNYGSAVVLGDFGGDGGFTGGDVFVFGDLLPGNSAASVLMDGSLALGAATTSEFEMGGTLGGEFDQLLVTGDLALAGSLDVSLINGFQLQQGMEFLIADVGDNLLGEFFGLGEGDMVGRFGGHDLFISYNAGDGNDIALRTAGSIPEPSGVLILLLGVAVVGTRRSKR